MLETIPKIHVLDLSVISLTCIMVEFALDASPTLRIPPEATADHETDKAHVIASTEPSNEVSNAPAADAEAVSTMPVQELAAPAHATSSSVSDIIVRYWTDDNSEEKKLIKTPYSEEFVKTGKLAIEGLDGSKQYFVDIAGSKDGVEADYSLPKSVYLGKS